MVIYQSMRFTRKSFYTKVHIESAIMVPSCFTHVSSFWVEYGFLQGYYRYETYPTTVLAKWSHKFVALNRPKEWCLLYNFWLQKHFLTKFWNLQWLLDVQNPNLEHFSMPIYCSNFSLIGQEFGNFWLQKRFLTKFWNPQWLLDVPNANLEHFSMPIAPILP